MKYEPNAALGFRYGSIYHIFATFATATATNTNTNRLLATTTILMIEIATSPNCYH